MTNDLTMDPYRHTLVNDYAQRLAPARIQWHVCLLTLLCAGPTMALISMKALRPASLCFFGILFVFVGYACIFQKPYVAGALIVALTPLLMMMRVLLFHNSVSVILGLILCMWLLLDHRNVLEKSRDPVLMLLVGLAFLYWWISFAATYKYSVNFRIFELALGAANVVFLSRKRSYLSSAFLGMAVTTFAMAFGLAGIGGERMGLAEVGEQSLGSPGQLSMPALLVFLLASSDNGRWLLLNTSPLARACVVGGSALVMLFAVHRTGWVLALTGITVLFFANPRRQIKPILTAIPIIIAMLVLALASDRGEIVQKYYMKVVDSDRTWDQRTTGRMEQYQMFPEILSQAPFLGHGPGSARDFDTLRAGVELTLHSAYLHFAAETGLVGLSVYLALLAAVFLRTLRYRQISGDATPMVLIVCMFADGLSHNNFSPLLGIFMGVAISSHDTRGLFVFRARASTAEDEADQAKWLPA